MVKRVGTTRTKTRHLYSVKKSERGKIYIRDFLQKFQNGEKVTIITNPRIQKGQAHRRFNSKQGTVKGKQGESYILTINDLGKEKTLYVKPIHLKKTKYLKKTK